MVVENEIIISKAEKTKLQETFRTSDQTQAAFAEVNGINPKTLAGWIYQQRLEARQNQNNVEFVELKRTVVKIRQGIIIRKAGIEIEMPSFDGYVIRKLIAFKNIYKRNFNVIFGNVICHKFVSNNYE